MEYEPSWTPHGGLVKLPRSLKEPLLSAWDLMGVPARYRHKVRGYECTAAEWGSIARLVADVLERQGPMPLVRYLQKWSWRGGG